MADHVTTFKVYTIDIKGDRPMLFEAAVTRETKQMLMLDFGFDENRDRDAYAAFGYRTRLPKDSARLSPHEAWTHYVKMQRHREARVETELSIARQHLVLAERELAKCQQPVPDAVAV